MENSGLGYQCAKEHCPILINLKTIMNHILTNKYSKGIIDIIMLLCFIACINASSVFEKYTINSENEEGLTNVHLLSTTHCIAGIILVCFIAIHIWQHWKFIKALLSKKILFKNKITALTSIAFMLLMIGLIVFIIGFTGSTLHIHSFFAHIFAIIIIIHMSTKLKSFIYLFLKKHPSKF